MVTPIETNVFVDLAFIVSLIAIYIYDRWKHSWIRTRRIVTKYLGVTGKNEEKS